MRAGQRKTRASLPHTQAGIEDISYLNLGEVRNRLERNERVLNTSLFSTSPPTNGGLLSTSPIDAADPFREKLLRARSALLEREKELLLEQGMGKMEMDNGASPGAESSLDARRRSSTGMQLPGGPSRSGKARAMEEIQAREVNLHPNGIILPYSTTLALQERDYDNATINKISQLSLNAPMPTKQRHPNDEIARAEAQARMARFMSYKPTLDDLEDGGVNPLEWEGEMEGDYDGADDRFALMPSGREAKFVEPGTGEEVDEAGEDDEEWAEGADEYLDRVRGGGDD